MTATPEQKMEPFKGPFRVEQYTTDLGLSRWGVYDDDADIIADSLSEREAQWLSARLNHPSQANAYPESVEGESYVPPEDRIEASRRQALPLVQYYLDLGDSLTPIKRMDLALIRDALQARSTPKPTPGDAAKRAAEEIAKRFERSVNMDWYSQETVDYWAKEVAAIIAQHTAPVLTEEEIDTLRSAADELADEYRTGLAEQVRAIIQRITGAQHG